jgi:hypothetical protein
MMEPLLNTAAGSSKVSRAPEPRMLDFYEMNKRVPIVIAIVAKMTCRM